MPAIGMAVPGATDLGLGSTLSVQAGTETDEERRRRLLAQQQQKLMPGTAGAASSLMTGYGAALQPMTPP